MQALDSTFVKLAASLGVGFVAILVALWLRGRMVQSDKERCAHQRTIAILLAAWAALVFITFWAVHLPSISEEQKRACALVFPHANRVVAFDADGQVTADLHPLPGGRHGLREPGGAVVSTSGRLYVADTGNQRVLKLDSAGHLLNGWKGFTLPVDVGVMEERKMLGIRPGLYGIQTGSGIAVLEEDGRVIKTDLEGKRVASVPAPGQTDLSFTHPRGLAVDYRGNIYVADTGANRVVKSSPSGQVLEVWEGLEQPTRVAIGERNDLFALDSGGKRVVRLAAMDERRSHYHLSTPAYDLKALPQDTGVALYLATDSGVKRLSVAEAHASQPGGTHRLAGAYPLAENARRSLFGLFGGLLVVGCAFCAGAWLAARLRMSDLSVSESLLIFTALGMAALMAGAFALACLNGFYVSSAALLLAVLAIPGLRPALAWARRARTALAQVTVGPFSVLLAAVVGATVCVNLVNGLTPPTDPDSLIYHLVMAKDLAGHHGFRPLQLLPANYPLGMELIYGLCLLLGTDVITKVVHFALGLVATVGVYAVGTRHFGARVGKVAAVIFYTTHVVQFISSISYNDFGLVVFSLAALCMLLRWAEEKKTPWLVALALFSGMGMWVKYHGAIGVIVSGGAVFVLSLAHGKKNLPAALVRGAGVGLFGLLLFAPWAVKNYVVTGNPCYPLLHRMFGGTDLTDFRAANIVAFAHYGVGLGRSLAHYLTLPWNLVVYGKPGDYKLFGNMLNPLFLALIPALLFVRRTPTPLRILGGYGFAFFVLWASVTQMVRLLLPALPVFSVLAAWVLVNFRVPPLSPRWSGWWRGVAACLLAVQATLSLVWLLMFWPVSRPFSVVLGMETREQYLSRRPDCHQAISFINQNLPREARVLFLWEDRTYYCQRPVLADGIVESWWFVEMMGHAGKAPAFLEGLRQRGMTHILHHNFRQQYLLSDTPARALVDPKQRAEFEADLTAAQDVWDELRQDYLTPLYSANDVEVFQVNYPDLPLDKSVATIQSGNGPAL